MTAEDVAQRDEAVRECVREYKFTTQQILDYSQCWAFPFHNVKEVDRRVTALRIRRSLRWKSDQGHHEAGVRAVFIKIATDFRKAGYEVYDMEFEYSIPQAAIRCDCKFRARPIGGAWPDYLYYLECERTLKRDKWQGVMTRYKTHRKASKPFRVPVVFEREAVLYRVHQTAGEVMQGEQSTIFLFAAAKDVLKPGTNAATGHCWATHPKEGRVKMVPLAPPL